MDDHSILSNLMALYPQPLYYTAMLKMLDDDLVDVFLATVAVPNLFRIHHHHRAFATTIKASRIVDPHPTLAMQAQLLDPLFGIFAYLAGIVILATIFIVTVMSTEKSMVLVKRHD